MTDGSREVACFEGIVALVEVMRLRSEHRQAVRTFCFAASAALSPLSMLAAACLTTTTTTTVVVVKE